MQIMISGEKKKENRVSSNTDSTSLSLPPNSRARSCAIWMPTAISRGMNRKTSEEISSISIGIWIIFRLPRPSRP